jgi:hypothetical protein
MPSRLPVCRRARPFQSKAGGGGLWDGWGRGGWGGGGGLGRQGMSVYDQKETLAK